MVVETKLYSVFNTGLVYCLGTTYDAKPQVAKAHRWSTQTSMPKETSTLVKVKRTSSVIFCILSVLQTRQPVFVQLLQGVFRVYHCNWLNPVQKASVEACIKVLSDVGKILGKCHVHDVALPERAVCHIITGAKWNESTFLTFSAKSRAIAIPVDLDSQVNNLFVKSNNVVQKSILNWRLSAKNTSRRDSGLTTSKDYRNIIERLQVS